MKLEFEPNLTEEQKAAMQHYYSKKLFYGVSPATITKDFLEIKRLREAGETKRADDFEKGLFQILKR